MTEPRPIRVLFIEDDDNDVALELEVLRDEGFAPRHEVVETPDALRDALTRPWDVIISDFRMPAMSGFDAIGIVQASGLQTPLILVSGTFGEEVAVDAVRAGAHDYVLKDRLARLGIAVRRALEEADARRRARLSSAALRLLADAGDVLSGSLEADPLAATARLAAERLGGRVELTVEGRRAAAGDGAGSFAIELPIAVGDDAPALGSLRLARGAAFDPLEVDVAHELARRTAVALENRRLYASAREAIRLREEFLAIASHELRTPLAALQLQLDGLARLVAELAGVDPRIPSRLDRANRSVQRLSSLVESLLDISRIAVDQIRLAREDLDLGELVREVVERLRPGAERAGTSLTLDAPAVRGRWDPIRLDQVLTNLLSNAIKYGAGQPVEVRVAERGDAAEIAVIDRGIGIAAEDVARIFDRFERAVPLRHYGGLGLGLYLARTIVEAHGGTVRALPTAGGGATFVVTLPRDVA